MRSMDSTGMLSRAICGVVRAFCLVGCWGTPLTRSWTPPHRAAVADEALRCVVQDEESGDVPQQLLEGSVAVAGDLLARHDGHAGRDVSDLLPTLARGTDRDLEQVLERQFQEVGGSRGEWQNRKEHGQQAGAGAPVGRGRCQGHGCDDHLIGTGRGPAQGGSSRARAIYTTPCAGPGGCATVVAPL
jgi:hypothetical protein